MAGRCVLGCLNSWTVQTWQTAKISASSLSVVNRSWIWARFSGTGMDRRLDEAGRGWTRLISTPTITTDLDLDVDDGSERRPLDLHSQPRSQPSSS